MALIPQQVSGKKLGSYELAKEVFTSGVGASYVAKSSTGESVLLTKIHRHVAKSPQLCDAFLAEAKAARALSHDTIAAVVDHGVADGEPFVAYAYTDSETLAALLRKAGPEGLGLGVAARIVLDLYEAIEAASSAGQTLSHGELGPWCVHIGVDGRARVTGFAVDRALVRFGLHYAKNLERLTYASPERVKAMSLTLGPAPPAPDLHSDTFSASVLAWELLSRQRLFASRMEAAIIQKVLTGPIADLKTVRAEISQDVSDAIAKGLKREPSERPSPEAIRQAFDIELALPEEVGRLVEASRGKAQTTRPEPARTGIGFNRSVTPKAFGAVRADAPVNGRGQNGEHAASEARRPLSVPPPAIGVLSPAGGAKKRAQTLIGFSSTGTPDASAAKAQAGAAPAAEIEDEATNVDVKVAAPAIAIPPAAPSSTDATDLIEEISTSDGELLLEEDTHVAAPKAPPPVSTPPPAPRRPPPKPRQVTLMGIEPVAEAEAKAEAKPAGPASPQPAAVAAQAATVPSTAKHDERPKLDVTKLAVVGGHDGPIRSGAILTTGSGRKYQLLSSVARGGMAIVWAARPVGSPGVEQIVAVKTMLPEVVHDADFEKMFLDEMRVAAQIKHPNVAEILELGEEDGILYLVMEWVEGEQLGVIQEAARTSGGIPVDVLLRIAAEACAGLHAAHELRDESGHLLDLVHRDINPTNVLLNAEGHVKVLDFGIAKSKGRLHVTRAGSIVKGKTPYLSPEQLGGLTLDRRSDLFSLGALFYLLATGLHPFRSENELQTLENIALKAPDPPRSIAPDIPADLDKVIMRLLEKDPKKRFSSAAEVQKEIERIETHLPKSATSADVAKFVDRVIGSSLSARRHELDAALATIEGRPPPPPPDSVGTAGQAVAAPVAVAPLDVAAFGASAAAAATDDIPMTSDDGRLDASTPFGGSAAAMEEPGPQPAAYDDDLPVSATKPTSPWTRLAILIGVGVAVGVLIIVLIESLRGPDAPPAPTTTAKATAAPTSPATQAAPPKTAEPIPPPPATETAAPVETAAPTASETAQPEETASAPPNPPTPPPPTPPPPVTSKPPTGKPPTGKPPAKPPKKHNPTTI